MSDYMYPLTTRVRITKSCQKDFVNRVNGGEIRGSAFKGSHVHRDNFCSQRRIPHYPSSKVPRLKLSSPFEIIFLNYRFRSHDRQVAR